MCHQMGWMFELLIRFRSTHVFFLVSKCEVIFVRNGGLWKYYWYFMDFPWEVAVVSNPQGRRCGWIPGSQLFPEGGVNECCQFLEGIGPTEMEVIFSKTFSSLSPIHPTKLQLGWTFFGGDRFVYFCFQCFFFCMKAGELSSIQHFGGGPLVSSPQIFGAVIFFAKQKNTGWFGYFASLRPLLVETKTLEKLGDFNFFSGLSWCTLLPSHWDPNRSRIRHPKKSASHHSQYVVSMCVFTSFSVYNIQT